MILRDLIDLVSKEKRKKVRVKAAQKFAVGMGIAAAAGMAAGILFAPKSGKEMREDLKEKAVNTVETIKNTVIQDIHKTAENISNELNKSVK